jgi:hypothetical protein
MAMVAVCAVFASASAQKSVPAAAVLRDQAPDRLPQSFDPSVMRALGNHLPQWATTAHGAGPVAANVVVDNMTLVLARSAAQEQAFEEFLNEQQEPGSAEYHHWLTPAEVGARFGLSQNDIDTVKGWLESEGLHVNWVAPSGIFIAFGGTAGDVGRAFKSELHYYEVNGERRMSLAADPQVPAALAPAIRAIDGLATADETPQLEMRTASSAAPDEDSNSGANYVTPADFAVIYDLPTGLTGAGVTIGILDESRTNPADFANFRALTGSTFANPTEIVPTAFGGVDPGPAYTAPPSNGSSTKLQSEATLDVMRAGSIAPGANLLLVTATASSGGIHADAQYLVETSPAPAQVMSISFSGCELNNGASGVDFWDTLFQQAAAEGISVFVSSGDSGASGCDTHGDPPPANPEPNSINYICASGYATCVGGTEFNDAGNPSQYWSPTNGPRLQSALGYIPEGAWNDPLDNGATIVRASGGGVSTVIATPAWQIGVGVPAARSGRYTPDVAFSASTHDGYFGCFAAASNGCVPLSGPYQFEIFGGTSGAAPSMAGIAALLDQNLGGAQGNLNPEIYAMAASTPEAFHDVTVATSGVSSCDVNTPSLCNNSIASPTGLTGGPSGYPVNAGYDEVTGWGSLDAKMFIDSFGAPLAQPTVTINPAPSANISTTQSLTVTVTVSGGSGNPAPTGSVGFVIGESFPSISLSGDSAAFTIAAGSLAPGSYTLAAYYSPDATSVSVFASASASIGVTVTATSAKLTPAMAIGPLQPSSTTLLNATNLQVPVTLSGGSGDPVPTGTVTLTCGSYSSGPLTLSLPSANPPSMATFVVPVGALPAGTDTLTITYSGDASYAGITNNTSVTISAPYAVTGTDVSLAAGATTGNASTITVTPADGFVGNVALNAVITSGPANANDPPTFLFGGSNPVSITGVAAGTATLTISTTPATTSTAEIPARPGSNWTAAGGAVLACVLFVFTPKRRRVWRNLLGMFALLLTLTAGIMACGGGIGTTTTTIPGTTAGTYTVTVTGTWSQTTAEPTTASGTFTLTVQ